MFSEGGICPACGKSKFQLPSKSREQIIYKKDKKETIEKVEYLKKRGTRLIIGGSILTILVLGAIILMAIYGVVIIYWYGGIFLGVSLIGKGSIDFQEKRELLLIFEKKHTGKLLNQ